MIGSRLGPWLIDQEVGRGGMGAVYRAHRIQGEGPDEVALKVLAAELALEVGFRQRFEREITILRQLNHPHIVRFLEAGEHGGRFYYAMEFVSGPTYEHRLAEKGQVPWAEVLDVALQVSSALKHAHDRGVIHRDLKPANLLRQPVDPAQPEGAFSVKLADFGIASLFASPTLTVTGGIVGTPEYLSPEQAAGKPVSRRSDLYSLGVVLYTLLTGRTPFVGDPVDLLHKHRYAQFERLSRLVDGLPPDLEEILCQLLEKDPARRPPDAGVLFRHLDRLKRKLQRKEAGEPATGQWVPFDVGKGEEEQGGPTGFLSRLVRRPVEGEWGTAGWWLLHQPGVLVVLLLATVGLICWTLWPLSQEGLYQRGAVLMASDDPADWDRAWDRFLEPLEEKYPDHPHQEEVNAFRARYQEYQAERQAARSARLARPQSEGEWFYYLGLRQRRRGEEGSARSTWQALIDAFAEVSAEKPWVLKAKQELEADPPGPEERDKQWRGAREAARRSAELDQQARQEEARKVREALNRLYQKDEAGQRVLQREGIEKGE